jgi:hypothetical protein
VYESQILITVISALCPWHDVIEVKLFAVEEVFSTVCAGKSLSTRNPSRLGG